MIGFGWKYFLSLKNINNFNVHPFKYHNNSFLRLLSSGRLLTKAIELRYINKRNFDVIISPDPLVNGFMAIIIGKIFKAKVIVEVNGNFESCFKFGAFGEIKPSLFERLKDFSSRFFIKGYYRKPTRLNWFIASSLFRLSYVMNHT